MATSAPQHEAAALADLAGRGLAGAVRRIEEVHQAIAERSFRSPGAAPARAVHDAVSGAVYGVLRGGGRRVGSALAARTEGRDISGTPRGALVQSALNGLHGDLLEAEGSPLAVPMAVRADGRDVALEPEALAAAFPDATERIVVFVHGLGETETAWRLGARERGGTYGSRLAAEHGVTPVALRFNTGLRISENGRRLADLLEALLAGWPADVARLDLVGHSMGGLVGRAACHVGSERGDAWLDAVCATVTLGTPHHGAPLEQTVNVLGWLLRRAPESTPLATVLEARSVGIKDLRFGAIRDEDWADCDPDALLDDRRGDVPLHDGARHYAVAATLTRSDRHPVARVLGDALVLAPSAHGRGRGGRRTGFGDEDVRHVGGVAHLALLNHAEVEELLVSWLAPAPAPG